MDKALRGQGCVMKRSKKQDGGAMRAMPDNLKKFIREKKMKNEGKPKRSPHRLPKMAKGE